MNTRCDTQSSLWRLRIGKVTQTAATLRFIGDDLDPDRVTEVLEKEPTSTKKRGEPYKLANGMELIARFGAWSFSVPYMQPGDLDRQIKLLLDGTTPDLSAWQQLSSSYRAEVFCGLFLHSYNEGISISAGTLKRLGDRGLQLDLDIYVLETDRDDENPEITIPD